MDYKKAFIDTSFFVSLYDENDPNHVRALQESSALDADTALFTSSEVLSESLTVISQKLGKRAANNFYTDVDPIELLMVDLDVFHASVSLFKQAKSKNVSFADCTSFVLCKENEIDFVFTFDKHFKKQGFQIID